MELVVGNLVARFTAETAEFQRSMRDATRVTADTQKAMQSSADAVGRLSSAYAALKQAYSTGTLSQKQYAEGLRTLQADIREVATQGTLTEGALKRLAATGASVERQLMSAARVSHREFRQTGALDALIGQFASLAGGATSVAGAVAGASSSMRTLTMTNPELFALVGIIGLIATAFERVTKNAEDAADSFKALATARGLGTVANVRQRIDDLRAQARYFPAWEGGYQGNRRRRAAREEADALEAVLPIMQNDLLRADNQHIERLRVKTFEMTKQKALLAAGVELVRLQDLGFRQFVENQKRAAENAAALGRSVLAATPLNAAGPPGGQLKAGVREALDNMKVLADSGLQLGGHVASAFTLLGQSLAHGFRGIGAAVKGVIGDLMVTIGKAMIAFGTAGLAIKNFIKSPVAAIAAGAALVVLGSALSSGAQGAVNAATGGGGGGGFGGSVSSLSSGVAPPAQNQTIIIHGAPRDVIQLDELASMLRDLGYRRIEWQAA